VELLLSKIKSKGTELHFAELKRRTAYQKQILEILNHDLIEPANVKYYVANKEFAVVGHIVDRLIEPVVYDLGEDLYRDKFNLELTNLLYHFGHLVWSKHVYHLFLMSFQEMARKQTEYSIQNFFTLTKELRQQADNEGQILDLILASGEQIKSILKGLHKYAMDLSLPMFIEICDGWGKQFEQAFDVIHDDSKQIDFWTERINFMANEKYMTPKEVGFDDRKIRFPLNINSLSLVKSQDSRHIQLADILTGSITYAVKTIYSQKNNSDDFANEILRSKIMNIDSNIMWPSLDEKEFRTPENEINALDYLAEMAAKHPEIHKKNNGESEKTIISIAKNSRNT
jgi:hypothetical protein